MSSGEQSRLGSSGLDKDSWWSHCPCGGKAQQPSSIHTYYQIYLVMNINTGFSSTSLAKQENKEINCIFTEFQPLHLPDVQITSLHVTGFLLLVTACQAWRFQSPG